MDEVIEEGVSASGWIEFDNKRVALENHINLDKEYEIVMDFDVEEDPFNVEGYPFNVEEVFL